MRLALAAYGIAVAATMDMAGWDSRPYQQTSQASVTRQLRVLTFNIHHAEGIDGRLDVARIAQLIRDTRADVVGLQEVDRGVERTGRRDLLKEIADLAQMRLAFGKNIDHQGGDYGNALLTSRPIVSEGNRLLPNATGGEQRGVLQVVIDVDGTQVLVLTTHFDHRRADGDRVLSADAMLGMVTAFGSGPVVAMGDFNDEPGSPTWTRLTTVLTDVWATVGSGDGFTIPVAAPTKRIDWILVRGLDPVSAEVLKTEASDHLPVVATLKVR
jgi:endonuclease/exonuclease/phosphatase family metal-dependent hydrolase